MTMTGITSPPKDTTDLRQVLPATPEDRARCTATVVAAFVNDPLMRWMFPDAEQYLAFFPQVIRHYGGTAFDLGSAFRTDDFSGAACWLAPGEAVDEEALGGVLESAIEPDRLGVVFEFMEQVGTAHPEVDHWHLPGIGVDPCRQGAGIGSLLLAHTLAEVDRDGVVAYLESSNPLNVPLYQRFGFEVIAEIQAGDSPPIWPMLRPAVGLA
jgi:ribosomal protein S18 acetylase RimI-like enzyme